MTNDIAIAIKLMLKLTVFIDIIIGLWCDKRLIICLIDGLFDALPFVIVDVFSNELTFTILNLTKLSSRIAKLVVAIVGRESSIIIGNTLGANILIIFGCNRGNSG